MAMLKDPLLSDAVSRLFDTVIYVAQTIANFKSELGLLLNTLNRITPIVRDVINLNQKLNRTKLESQMFIDEIQDAEKLVRKCLKIKRNFIKKFSHSLKLKDVNNKLLQFFQLEVQAVQTRDIKQALVEVNDVSQKLDSLSMNVRELHQTVSCNSMSTSYRREQVGPCEWDRGRLGWRVPSLPRGIVAFDEPLKKLKDKILADDIDDEGGCSMETDDGSVVVVAAAGGCGKTTLVTKLCHDPEIQDKFGEKVFFVTVSETPNFMVIVNDLFNPSSFGQPIPFQSDEDAKHKLDNFLREKLPSPMLIVLDDVWCDSFINNFPSNIKGCKILVTSRTAFPKFDVFKFDPLSDEDAKTLFQRSAFTESKKRPRAAVDDVLVVQMVKRCKRHPLTLSVVGGSLNGRDELAWKSMLKSLNQGISVLDMNEQVRIRLERSFKTLDEEFKECFMDFGLFPEDQRIPASALLDMWMHLYNHDDQGIDTFDKIVGLSYRHLVSLMATGLKKDSGATFNYCDHQFVKQHDLLRELAIHLSSKAEVPVTRRKRLIINARGENLPASIIQVQEPMEARILSISTGESFSSKWCNMKVTNVEVTVLNLMSKTYTLPHFLMDMQKMKVLNVTNYGLYPTHIEDFHLIGCLSNLSRIRLERVSISSLSPSILALVNLQKVSFIMCKIGNAFENLISSNNFQVWPRLVEFEMDYCQDVVEFPSLLCSSVHLKMLTITNCNDMGLLPNEFGNLTNLETLSLRSCTKLEKLPESITRLEKLNILDISDCLNLEALPEDMGNLSGLRTIYMKGCTGIHELPSSVEELYNTNVVCDEEIYYKWCEYDNVEIDLVEENRLETLMLII
ncbi:probable disease resistance protein At5g66900 [Rutidosis leptorrhynchoides]|uniref:probable disease resistance protein At5g66900 n=1 Tax=Rutidosis leptorrhynchoides TaxID=125765 RepID=UPI003A9A4924